jgi:hypothetical protein
LFDLGCGLVAASFAVNGAVTAGSTQASIVSQGIAKPGGSGTYTLGRMVFTSGLNNTFQRFITNWDGNATLTLINPLPFAVAIGDSFTIYPGCDKSYAATTGCAGFNNQVNYGGTPFVPPAEAAA